MTGSGTNTPRFHKQLTGNGKKMLNDNAKKWVASLRSGEYEQGKDFLCCDGKFCCLGVGSDLYAKEHPDFEVKQRQDSDNRTVTKYGDCFSTCPFPVQEWLGLSSSLGAWMQGSLVSKNDTGMPFSEIADIIESEPEGLFV